MAALKRNVIANSLGQIWSGIIGFVFVPFYIKYLGVEAYGLVGIFLVLQAALGLLDMGLTPALGREMARWVGGARSTRSVGDLLRSVEVVAIVMAGVIALLIGGAARWIATRWIHAGSLTPDTLTKAIVIMGAVVAMRFVEDIYHSCIVGLQRQVTLNLITAVAATVRALGAVAVLAWLSPTITAFFAWQAAVSALTTLAFAGVTYYLLPAGITSSRFSFAELRLIVPFAGGMAVLSVLWVALSQVDKVLLSKLLSLSEYGYYTLGALVASTLYLVVNPITQAWFPRMSELHAAGDEEGVARTFHEGSQLVAVLVGSVGMVLILFAEEALRLWTRDAELASHVATLVRLLVLGNLLHNLTAMPIYAQLAHGWTALSIRIVGLGVILLVPAILWLTPRFGAQGAAIAWVGFHALNLLVGMHFMYRKILIAEKWRWYWEDVLRPIAAAIVVVELMRVVSPHGASALMSFAWLSLTGLLSLVAATLAAPRVRRHLLDFAMLSRFRASLAER